MSKAIIIRCFTVDEVKFLFLFLESLYIYGNLDDDTHIYIFTINQQILERIHNSNLMNPRIHVELYAFNTIHNVNIHFLHYMKNICLNYSRILFMNNQSIVLNDINQVFDSIETDTIYGIDISVQILGFIGKENQAIYKIMDMIESDSILLSSPDVHSVIIYYAVKQMVFNNTILSKHIELNSVDKTSNHSSLHHFIHISYEKVFQFLASCKDVKINEYIQETKRIIESDLLPIINQTGEPLEGNLFMTHLTTDYNTEYVLKQKNLCNIMMNSQIKTGLEIGFNAGFSALLILLTNKNITLTCADIGLHSYTQPCYKRLRELFGDRITLYEGDSRELLNRFSGTCDFIHIDGGHEPDIAESDIQHSYRLSHKRTVQIMDDTDSTSLKSIWDRYINKYGYKQPDWLIYQTPYHDIKQVGETCISF